MLRVAMHACNVCRAMMEDIFGRSRETGLAQESHCRDVPSHRCHLQRVSVSPSLESKQASYMKGRLFQPIGVGQVSSRSDKLLE